MHNSALYFILAYWMIYFMSTKKSRIVAYL